MSLRMLLSIAPPSAHLVFACPPSFLLHSMGHVMGTMSETPWHSQTHLLSPPISRGDYSTFMVKRFFSFVRVNVMPLWPWLILVAIALICPSSYLLLGWGCKSDKPILLHSAPTPLGSPVSSERPVDTGRGGVQGSWTLPVAWLATDVGVVEGGNPTPLG